MRRRLVDDLPALLQLVSAHGGTLEGRVRLQKWAYIFKYLGVPGFTNLYFRYQQYGPYSQELSFLVSQAVSQGLLQQETDNPGWTDTATDVRYRYLLLPDGKQMLQGSDFPSFELPPDTRNLHWRVLELAATTLFLEQDEGLERQAALDRAIELKPPCSGFKVQTQTFLDRLPRLLDEMQNPSLTPPTP